ncbi:MAG: NUDIX domain-containing protein [Chloroflexi bacterium]|nr:NUDIX domain-containing protein [Chloroflexota bacterium]
MPTTSASAIVFTEDRQRVLLIKREDFRIWVLPGGGIEPGETLEQAVIRETREESGYHVAIERLVGKYWHPQTSRGGNLMHLFEARLIGGAPISRGPETRAVDFFRWVSCRRGSCRGRGRTLRTRWQTRRLSLCALNDCLFTKL